MRKIILGLVLGFVFSIGSYRAVKAGNGFCEPSDPCGGWVKVDASGLVISGAIVCTPSVCGAGTLYSKLTLKEGEQWVQQTKADPVTGNVVGIGNNNPNTTVTYDRPAETFTVVVEPPNPAPTALSPEATSVPQPNPEQPTQSAPQPTAEPTQSAPQPIATTAPTEAPIAVPTVAPTEVPRVVPTAVPVPTVDPSIIPNTYEFKLSDTEDGNIKWYPKRRKLGEQQAI